MWFVLCNSKFKFRTQKHVSSFLLMELSVRIHLSPVNGLRHLNPLPSVMLTVAQMAFQKCLLVVLLYVHIQIHEAIHSLVAILRDSCLAKNF